ncbi:beta-galactosidase [Paenibacillus sp. FSL P4-0081]|uniref:beta-galactosidase n=1 Tax=Paenibacillus sp. FSL P4-0081 TaxID=1536769 RepID=UPI0004F5BF60|nr:beta-galactosidase [Paenibacillus sp. FSL P4-0081]AIQ28398.1 beta-galactosidase [Paenibacillus sp. FSL P4-0081]
MNHKLYYGAAWYPELWGEAERKHDLQLMNKTGINLVRMGEFIWSELEPEEGSIDIRPFAEHIRQLHAYGIDTIMCTPTATPPVWLTHGHPERLVIRADGAVMGHGSRQHVCTNHPYFRQRAAIITEQLAKELGQLPGLVAWQLDNELKAHVSECMCGTCKSLWHEWLKSRYGNIGKLNEAWGTGVWSQTYQQFDQVPQPVATPFLHNSSLVTLYRLFQMETTAGFAAEQAAVLRRYSPAPITHNSSVAFHVDNEQLFRELDFASYDTYASQTNKHAYLLNCDLWRNIKPERDFWLLETSPAYAGSLMSYGEPHPDGYLTAEAVSAYALGAGAFCYWLWRQQRTGSEQTHSSIISAWGQPALGYDNVREASAARLLIEPHLLATRPVQAEVAITYSDRTKAYLATEPHRKLSYRSLLGDYYKRVLDMGIHRDLLPEGGELSGYKLLFTPFVHYLSPEYMQKALSFAEAGGIWIAGPLSGGRTADHTLHTDAALGGLERIAGVITRYVYPMEGTGSIGEAFGISAPLSLWSAVFEPLPGGATVTGRITAGRTPGLAFLTEQPYGRGAIVMLGSLPSGEAGDKLLCALIDHYAARAGVTLRSDVTAGTVVCPRHGASGELWTIVNMDGLGGSVTLPRGGQDVLSDEHVPAGPLMVGAYGYRLIAL